MPTSTIMVTSFRIGLTAFQLNRGERASQSQCQPPRNSERRRFGWIICVIFQNILIRKDIIFSDEILLINKILNIHMSFFVDQQNFEQSPIIFLLINKILNNSLSFFYWSTKFWTVHYHFFIDQQNFEQLTIIFLLINKILNNSLSFFIDQQNFEIHQKSRFPTFSDNCEYLETNHQVSTLLVFRTALAGSAPDTHRRLWALQSAKKEWKDKGVGISFFQVNYDLNYFLLLETTQEFAPLIS